MPVVSRRTVIIEFLGRSLVLLFWPLFSPGSSLKTRPFAGSSDRNNNASCTCHGFRSFRLLNPFDLCSFHAMHGTNLVPWPRWKATRPDHAAYCRKNRDFLGIACVCHTYAALHSPSCLSPKFLARVIRRELSMQPVPLDHHRESWKATLLSHYACKLARNITSMHKRYAAFSPNGYTGCSGSFLTLYRPQIKKKKALFV